MKDNEKKELEKKDQSYGERFTSYLQKEMKAISSQGTDLTPHQKKLAYHLFLTCDKTLIELEKNRQKKGGGGAPYVWANINLPDFVNKTVPIVQMGLDAFLPAHVYPVARWSKNNEYTLTPQVGYRGMLYAALKYAVNQPRDIVISLVRENDDFKYLPKAGERSIESYDPGIKYLFSTEKRGAVIGGYGYIVYQNPELNRFIPVTMEEIQKRRKKAQSTTFWDAWEEEMMLSKIARIVCKEVPLDPEKTNSDAIRAVVEAEYEDDQTELIDHKQTKEWTANTKTMQEPEVTEDGEVIEDETEFPDNPFDK